MPVKEVTNENLKEFVQSKPMVVLNFWATWCGPCRMFAPIYSAAAEKHADIAFGKVEIDSHGEVAEKFEVRAVPTTVLIKDEHIVFQHSGLIPEESFGALMDRLRQAEIVYEEEAKDEA